MKHMCKKIGAIALLLTMLLSLAAPALAADEHWATPYLDYLAEKKLLGTVFSKSELSGKLDSLITREEFFALTMLATEIAPSGKTSAAQNLMDFSNVGSKYAPYLQLAYEHNILQGSLVGGVLQALPQGKITREEVVTIIGRCANNPMDLPSDFEDFDQVGAFARPYLVALNRANLINGVGDNQFLPQASIKWGETIKIVALAHQNRLFNPIRSLRYAGDSTLNSADGPMLLSSFYYPYGLTYNSSGSLLVVDSRNNLLREISNKGVSTVAGRVGVRDLTGRSVGGFDDGKNEAVRFNEPKGIIATSNGAIIADSGNNLVRYYEQGQVTTLAGALLAGYQDGPSNKALFSNPSDIALGENGQLYIADTGNNVIRMLNTAGQVTTFAGLQSTNGGYKDGSALEAEFCAPQGLEYHNGTLYVADTGNARIRAIRDGVVTTIAGNGTQRSELDGTIIGDYFDGGKDVSCFNIPTGISVDTTGNLYVADTGNGMIRKIDTKGTVSTVVGLSRGLTATADILQNPLHLFWHNNTLYVTDGPQNMLVYIPLQ